MVVHVDGKVAQLYGEEMPCPRDSCDNRLRLEPPDNQLLYFLNNETG